MTPRQALYFTHIANHFGASKKQLDGFTPPTARLIEQSRLRAPRLESVLLNSQESLNRLHDLWLAQALTPLSNKVKSICIAALTAKRALALLHHFKLPLPRRLFSPFFKAMALHFLFKKCYSAKPLSLALLPPSSLNQLLRLSTHQLTQLIDLLGLAELASELQQVIDQRVYVALFNQLSVYEKSYLAVLRGQRLRWLLPKVGIGSWLQDVRGALQRRGMLRFCVALSGMDPDFLWHLERKFDPRAAHLIAQRVKEQAIEGATVAVREEIERLVTTFTTKADSL